MKDIDFATQIVDLELEIEQLKEEIILLNALTKKQRLLLLQWQERYKSAGTLFEETEFITA